MQPHVPSTFNLCLFMPQKRQCMQCSSENKLFWGNFKKIKVKVQKNRDNVEIRPLWSDPDMKFVNKFTRPNFRAKEFYKRKTRKLRFFHLQ